MIIANNIDNTTSNNIYFGDSIKNTVIDDGIFKPIIYSTENVSTSGVYIIMPFKSINIEYGSIANKYTYKLNTNDTTNRININKFIQLEKNILDDLFPDTNKIAQYKLTDQLSQGMFKLFDERNVSLNDLIYNTTYILKISGIWETDTQYGITFKLLTYAK